MGNQNLLIEGNSKKNKEQRKEKRHPSGQYSTQKTKYLPLRTLPKTGTQVLGKDILIKIC